MITHQGSGLQQLFSGIWDYIVRSLNEKEYVFTRRLILLVNCICDFLNFPFPDSPSLSQGIYKFKIDTSHAFEVTTIPTKIPFIFLQRKKFLSSDVAKLRSFLGPPSSSHNIVILVSFADEDTIKEIKQLLQSELEEIYAYDIVVLGHKDLLFIFSSSDPRQSFRSLVMPQINLARVSPFQITGPTPETMFFGREEELRQVITYAAKASYAIIGGRRVGKTSILLHLGKRLPPAGFDPFYLDCSATPTIDEFLEAAKEKWLPLERPQSTLSLSELIQRLPRGKPVILLDEVDKLVPMDRANQWQIFNTLRASINSGHIQVVLSGERTLREALQDPGGPLFNFANEILLGPLEFRAVGELITRPMKQLEIELEDEEATICYIYDFTSGHPNVVQRLCRRLIERLYKGNRRITRDDVDAVINNPRFQEEDFLATYWERATPLEQIISLLMAQEDKPYRLQAILDLLAVQDLQPEPEVVKAALDRLVELRSILKRSQAGYEFSVKAFPHVLANTTTAEDMLIVLKSQYLKNPMEMAE